MELLIVMVVSVVILSCAVFGLASLFENYLSMPIARSSVYIMNLLRN